MTEEEKVQEIIKEILGFVETIPEEYRLVTYEVLLKVRLLGPPGKEGRKGEEEPLWDITIHMNVRAFLKANSISEDVLKKLFIANESTIAKIYTIKTTKKAAAQIQIACLTALEHALRDGIFTFGIEEIRQRVKDENCYDGSNFKPTFRGHKNLFKSLDDPTHIELSQEGMTELAKVIGEMSE